MENEKSIVILPQYLVFKSDTINNNVLEHFRTMVVNKSIFPIEGYLNKTDVKSILDFDTLVKKQLKLNPLNIPEAKLTANKAIIGLENDSVLSSLFDKSLDNPAYITDVLLSKEEKPYKLYVFNDILFIITYVGFGNLLLSNNLEVFRMLQSDIVREYQRAFGSEHLHGSTLFNVYMKNLETGIHS